MAKKKKHRASFKNVKKRLSILKADCRFRFVRKIVQLPRAKYSWKLYFPTCCAMTKTCLESSNELEVAKADASRFEMRPTGSSCDFLSRSFNDGLSLSIIFHRACEYALPLSAIRLGCHSYVNRRAFSSSLHTCERHTRERLFQNRTIDLCQ